ncbi:MAG: hypothetical protein ACK5LC_16980, partial [Coprobacillaceae bacterium]
MRKLLLALCIMFICLIPTNISAYNQRVFDNADLLDEDDIDELEDKIDTLQDKYDIDIVLL